ncbi:Glutathione S-transferase [Gryllus bimaculatus]|nr:Glutathione S-transferase [Gryllus bimaculatus]
MNNEHSSSRSPRRLGALSIAVFRKTLDVYLAPDCKSKEKLREKLVNETFPFYFSKLDKMVLDNGGFFVGGQLSWVDIFFTSGVEGYNVVGMDEDLLKNYPNLSDLNKTIRSLPAIQSWLNKRPFSAF